MQMAPQIAQLVQKITAQKNAQNDLKPREKEPVIKVDDIASQIAHLYEKMRYSVDYKEEHLLRRSAIERMLKRRLLESFRKGNIATFLIEEIIRAGYIANDTLPIRIIDDIQKIIDKNIQLYNLIHSPQHDILGTSPAFNRIISLAATEIEERLFPPLIELAAADALYLTVRDRINVKDATNLSHEELTMQIYIASYRSFLHYDEASLFYRLWNLYFPLWQQGQPSQADLENIALHFSSYQEEILSQLHHPLNWRIMPKLRDDAIFFTLIKESIEQKPDLWQAEHPSLKKIIKHISTILSQKYAQEKSIIKKSVVRVMTYILLTKIILAFIIELPYDIFIHGTVNKLALGTNIIFHPLLLFTVTRVVRLPRNDSRKETLERITDIITHKPLPQITVWMRRKKNLFGIILTIIYLFFFLIIFGTLLWILKILAFNIVSSALFILFLTLVSYFGLRIRNRAKRWRVTPRKTSFTSFLVDLMVLPIIQAGQWITKKFDKVNIFVFFMDFVVETPFKILVQILEGFTLYLKEKKEELE